MIHISTERQAALTRYLTKEANFGTVLKDCILASIALFCVGWCWLQFPLMRERVEQPIELAVPDHLHATDVGIIM